jgi:hypothetical protein
VGWLDTLWVAHAVDESFARLYETDKFSGHKKTLRKIASVLTMFGRTYKMFVAEYKGIPHTDARLRV